MMRSSYLELFCYVMQINLLFLIYRSNPSGSITPHNWFNYFLESKGWARASRLLERALSLRSSSINSLLGGPWRVFCQLDIFAYPIRVILHKVFVDARLQRTKGSTFGRATGLIHLDRLHPIRGLLPWKQRLSSSLTSLRTCFKPEIVVYKFLFGRAPESILSAWYFCLFKTSNPA